MNIGGNGPFKKNNIKPNFSKYVRLRKKRK